PALIYIYCNNNPSLIELNIRNGNNFNMVEMEGGAPVPFDATNNPSLSCIQVDDIDFALSRLDWVKDAQTTYDTLCICNINIPDTNFKSALLANPEINTNGNDEIECLEAILFSGSMNVSDAGITDLTGIEAFTSLGQLNCSFNQLTSLNLSSLQNLSQLLCNNNQLTALDLSSNQLLELIECSNNQINALDLSQNPFINWVICNNNNLQSLNVRNGNNVNFFNFSAVGNPNLSCIQVDNIDYASSANDWSKDESAFYSENCNCVQGETNYVVGLFDAAENGWDGANLVIYDLSNFNEVVNVSLATGGVGFVDVCLGAQCFGITAGGGEGDEEISWSIAGGNDFQLSGVANSPEVQTFSPGGTVGCIDPIACNFDSLAVCDDGSCVYPSCTDDFACNYDSQAACSDSSICTYQGCTDPAACNYDAFAGCLDQS
ncbi:MAG: hypothetical protein ACKOSR_03985, partial [Flavobacteriales bacterium]